MDNQNKVPNLGAKSRIQTRDLVSAAFLLAMIILLSSTPLGFIRLGVTALTIIHVPVIVGSITLGPKYGAFLGFSFGMASLLNATFAPDLTSFAFSPFYSVGEVQGNGWSLVVAFVPRILVGIVPYFVYRFFGKKLMANETFSLIMAGIAGSLTNTIFVLGFIYLFFARDFSVVVGETTETLYKFLLALIATNGLPEAILASVFTVAICKAILIQKRSRNIDK